MQLRYLVALEGDIHIVGVKSREIIDTQSKEALFNELKKHEAIKFERLDSGFIKEQALLYLEAQEVETVQNFINQFNQTQDDPLEPKLENIQPSHFAEPKSF